MARSKTRKGKRKGPMKHGLFSFLTTTVVAAMRRGQLPVYCVFITLWIFLWRTPSDVYGMIWAKLLEPPGFVFALSIGLNVVGPFATWKLIRWQRSRSENEMKRMSSARNQAQEKAGLPIHSSEDAS